MGALMDAFTDVVWTDETSVQMESHRRGSTVASVDPNQGYAWCILHTMYMYLYMYTYIYTLPSLACSIHVYPDHYDYTFSYCHLQSKTFDKSP